MDRREIIMKHYNDPKNRKRISDSSYIVENTSNSSCIDNLDIYIKIKDGAIADIAFDGEACAISISSASIMSDNLKGKSLVDASNYVNNMENMLNGKNYDSDILKEAAIYEYVKDTSRKTCAWLPYEAVKKILTCYKN